MVISRCYAKQAALLTVVAFSACTPQSVAPTRSPSPAAILPVNPIYAGRATAFDVNATFAESMNESFTVQRSIGDSGTLGPTGEAHSFGPAPIDFAAGDPSRATLPHLIVARLASASVSIVDHAATGSASLSDVCIFSRPEANSPCALALATASSGTTVDCVGRHSAESSVTGLKIFGAEVPVTGSPNQRFTSSTQYGHATGTINFREFDSSTNTMRAASVTATFNFPTGFQVVLGTIVVASATSACAA
jgi:hypothetical protein